MRSQEQDPRSPSYKRTLVRPKVPVLQLLFFTLLIGGVCVIGFIIANRFFITFISLIIAVILGLLAGLLFGKHILIALIKTYQALAPASLRERCRYEPSCSTYMIMAIEKYGFWRGTRKGLKRWKSCKPPNGGIDMP